MLTYLYEKDIYEGSSGIVIDNFNFFIACQDSEVVLPNNIPIKVTTINYEAFLKGKQNIEIVPNESYVYYTFISVPKVYKDYNINVVSKAFKENDVLSSIHLYKNYEIFDLNELIDDFK